MNDHLVFTKAGVEHCALVFGWANDPETRKNSFNTEPIPYEKHVAWYMKKIIDPSCYFFVISSEGSFVGQARIAVEKNIGQISYAVSKDHRGKGIGTAIICMLPRIVSMYSILVQVLEGEVKLSNTASQKCFEHCGYSKEVAAGKIIYRLEI